MARGYPAPETTAFHWGREFRAFLEGEQPEPGEKINLGWKYAGQFSEPRTPEREAADIYLNIVEVEAALGGGDVALVFAHALRLGAAVNRFNARRLHLKTIPTGAKVQKAAKSAASKTNAMHGPQKQLRFVRMG